MGTSDEKPPPRDERDSTRRDNTRADRTDRTGTGRARTDQTGSDIIEQHAEQLADQALPERESHPSESAPASGREYRAAELAEAAGITPRTLRFYRERKLLDPPRKDGRIAWYGEHHLARLRTIAALLTRGHTLGGIADLMVAFEQGKDSETAAELLGLPPDLTPRFSDETPVRLTPEELAAHFPGEDTPENLSTAIELGYLRIEGDEIVHISRRLLDASTALVSQDVPLAAVLAAGQDVRTHVENIASMFSELLMEHLLSTTDDDLERVTSAIELLRPFATQAVEAELTMALDRKVRTEFEEWLRDKQRTQKAEDG